MAKPKRRYYEEIRSQVEQHGGSMTFQRKGFPRGGAWVVDYMRRQTTFLWHDRSFPDLDALYIPKRPNPIHFDDYTNQLISGAWEQFVVSLNE